MRDVSAHPLADQPLAGSSRGRGSGRSRHCGPVSTSGGAGLRAFTAPPGDAGRGAAEKRPAANRSLFRRRRLHCTAACALVVVAISAASAPASPGPLGPHHLSTVGAPAPSRVTAIQVVQLESQQQPETGDEAGGQTGGETGAADVREWEQQWRSDEALLAERWPELEENTEEAIKQRFREIRGQAEQARQALAALADEMDQLHRQQTEEMQARHARERTAAAVEGDPAAEVDRRHQQEQAALQGDQQAARARLAEARQELEKHLEGARRDVARAREGAAGGGEADRSPEISRLQPEALGGNGFSPPAESTPATAAPPTFASGDDSGGPPAPGNLEQQTATAASPEDDLPGDDLPGDDLPDSDLGGPRAGPPEERMMAQTPSAPPASPPEDAGGQDPLAVEDRAAQGVDAAETAAGPAASAPPRPEAPSSDQELTGLIDRGNTLLDLGDLAAARLYYRRAAGRGSAEGAMLMGMTFDPLYFAHTGVHGTQPRIEEALEWYRKAIAMGSRPAEARMESLRAWLERSAAAGDAQAEAALERLR